VRVHTPAVIDDDWAGLDAILDDARGAAGAYLATLRARPPAAIPPDVPAPALPEDGIGARAAIARFVRDYEPHLSASAGPRYLGFVTGGTTPAALAGDWLASAYDQNLVNDSDSIAGLAERHALAMLRDLFGLPGVFEGAFVTGGTQANLVGLAAARQWAYRRIAEPIDIAEHGLAGAPRVPVLGGAPHASVGKALAILGWGRAALERVGCLPGRQAVDPAALDARLAHHGAPAVIVANAGDVNTGDFDDLAALADIADRRGAWLHVDGAIGLPAACAPSHAHLLRGLDRADSVSGDAHKWLNVPYDAGFIFTRHLAAQQAVFTSTAAYFGAGDPLLHRTPENSRRFRALPALLSLLAYGRRGHRAMIERAIACAARLAASLPPAFELLAPVRLNIVCFALRGADEATTARVLRALHHDGVAFMTPTVLDRRPALRAAFSNWATDEHDVKLVVSALEAAARRAA